MENKFFVLLFLFLLIGNVSADLYSEDNLYGIKVESITTINQYNNITNLTGVLLDTGDTATGNYFLTSGNGLVVGHTSFIDFGATPSFQVVGTSTPTSSLGFARFEDNAAGGDFRFLKSRGATIGANTLPSSGDTIGRIRFQIADGLDFNTPAVQIHAIVDGTPGNNDAPGALIFSTTADGASSVTERMRITNTGIIVGTSTSPQNIIMFSPDGTSFSCGVTNGGTFACV